MAHSNSLTPGEVWRRSARTVSRGFRAITVTPAALETIWWFAIVLMVTCVSKALYLRQVYGKGLGFVLSEMAAGGHARAKVALFVFAADVVQVAVLALLTVSIARALPRTLGRVVPGAVMALCFLWFAANHLSVQQIGSFASLDTIATSLVFAARHREMWSSYLTKSTLLGALCIALCAVLPTLISARSATRARWLRVQQPLEGMALVLVVMAAMLVMLAGRTFPSSPFPLKGYLTSLGAALSADDGADPSQLEPRPESQLLRDYQALAYPQGRPAAPDILAPELLARARPRHVLLVGLETAPRAFYALTSASDLPNFRRMTEQAIVSDHHYTNTPYTRRANFSMLSGLYAPPSGLPTRFGDIATDGLASVLARSGYQTTYVDSWVLDWLPGSGERKQARELGFQHVLDHAEHRDDGSFEQLLASEGRSFDQAFDAIRTAQASGKHAAVFVGTMLGHFPWPTPKGAPALDGVHAVKRIVRGLDGLFGRLLDRIAEAGLENEVLIAVVGDHGLRYADEFASLGHHPSHSDLAFNVPFLVHAPGLTQKTVRVPWPTSHVDITPTLLRLVGKDTSGMLHHGEFMLDRRLAQRAVFMFNTGLSPVDGLTFQGHYVTHNSLSGEDQIGSGLPGSFAHLDPRQPHDGLARPLLAPRELLRDAERHANLMAAAVLRRGRAQARARRTQ